MTRLPLVFLLPGLLVLPGCGCSTKPDPEKQARNEAAQDDWRAAMDSARSILDAAHADPNPTTLRAVLPLTSALGHASWGTEEVPFAYGPSKAITVNAMANLLLQQHRTVAMTAAFEELAGPEVGLARGTPAEIALRWLLATLSEQPMVMLSVAVTAPGSTDPIGYVEGGGNFPDMGSIAADPTQLPVLTAYLRQRLLPK